ncbi:hypothetical protein FUAX_44440 (plasmid) [Fulvitalea axinellae]|uniref:Uncharacterized protein n=1 Tax=Fulvitalea axinellae TaxID=1182444 RepID=A0AAU9CVP8_9BACT|nr:hypothetical protein FUAX_44440 [Fulvitalea axinellae]
MKSISINIKILISLFFLLAHVSVCTGQTWEKKRIVFPEREKLQKANTGKSVGISGQYAVAITDGGLVVWKQDGIEWKIQAKLSLTGIPSMRFESAKIEGNYIAGLYQGSLYVYEKKNGEWQDSQNAVRIDSPIGKIKDGKFETASNALAFISYNEQNEMYSDIQLYQRPETGWASDSELKPITFTLSDSLWRIGLSDQVLCAVSCGPEYTFKIFEKGDVWNSEIPAVKSYAFNAPDNSNPVSFGYAVSVDANVIASMELATGYIHLVEKKNGEWPETLGATTAKLRPSDYKFIDNATLPQINLNLSASGLLVAYALEGVPWAKVELFEPSGDDWLRSDPRMIFKQEIKAGAPEYYYGELEISAGYDGNNIAIHMDGKKNIPEDYENLNFYAKTTFWPKAIKADYERSGSLRKMIRSDKPWFEKRELVYANEKELWAMPVNRRGRLSVGLYEISEMEKTPLAYLDVDDLSFYPVAIALENNRLFVLSQNLELGGYRVFVFEKPAVAWRSTHEPNAVIDIKGTVQSNEKAILRFSENVLEIWDGKRLYQFNQTEGEWAPINEPDDLAVDESDFISDDFAWNNTEAVRLIISENEGKIYSFAKENQGYSDTPVVVGNLSEDESIMPNSSLSVSGDGLITVGGGDVVYIFSKEQEGGYKKIKISISDYLTNGSKTEILSTLILDNSFFVAYKTNRGGQWYVEAMVLTKNDSEEWDSNLSKEILAKGKADIDLLKSANTIASLRLVDNGVILFNRFYNNEDKQGASEAFVVFGKNE